MNVLRSTSKTANMVKIAMLGAIGFILTYLVIPIPIFPDFLKMEISDIAALIGAVTMGPMAGAAVELVKNLIDFIVKPVAAGLGQFANLVISCSFILPLGLIYGRRKSMFGLVLGEIVGGLAMVALAALLNYFLLIPLYAGFFGVGVSYFVDLTAKVNGLVSDFKSLIVFAIVPFNVVKVLFNAILGALFYKSIKSALFKSG